MEPGSRLRIPHRDARAHRKQHAVPGRTASEHFRRLQFRAFRISTNHRALKAHRAPASLMPDQETTMHDFFRRVFGLGLAATILAAPAAAIATGTARRAGGRADRRAEIARSARGHRGQRLPHPHECLRRSRSLPRRDPGGRAGAREELDHQRRRHRVHLRAQKRYQLPRRHTVQRAGGRVQLRPDARREPPLPRHRPLPALVLLLRRPRTPRRSTRTPSSSRSTPPTRRSCRTSPIRPD